MFAVGNGHDLRSALCNQSIADEIPGGGEIFQASYSFGGVPGSVPSNSFVKWLL